MRKLIWLLSFWCFWFTTIIRVHVARSNRVVVLSLFLFVFLCLLVCECVFAFCCMAERWSEFFTWGEIFRILPSISVFFLLKCLKFQLSFYIFSFFLSFSSCQYHFTFTTSLNLWHFGMINLCFSFSHDQRKLSYLEKEKKIRKSIF